MHDTETQSTLVARRFWFCVRGDKPSLVSSACLQVVKLRATSVAADIFGGEK